MLVKGHSIAIDILVDGFGSFFPSRRTSNGIFVDKSRNLFLSNCPFLRSKIPSIDRPVVRWILHSISFLSFRRANWPSVSSKRWVSWWKEASLSLFGNIPPHPKLAPLAFDLHPVSLVHRSVSTTSDVEESTNPWMPAGTGEPPPIRWQLVHAGEWTVSSCHDE